MEIVKGAMPRNPDRIKRPKPNADNIRIIRYSRFSHSTYDKILQVKPDFQGKALGTAAAVPRVTIGPAKNPDTAAHIMTDSPPYLTGGRRQSRSYAFAGVLHTCTHHFVLKSGKDDLSDHITVFHLSIDQI
ncbi:hypothetical protein TNCV_897741 [Trichonephila clavipes]|nr:hypothetical protein TNCV_897741 [Trichonephila clavipes]